MRPAFGLLLGLGAIAAALLGWSPDFGLARARTEQPERVVQGPARVRDGDTIVVGGTPVRLAGLHCPELDERGGQAAAAAMRSLVLRGYVSCQLTGARTYDREVGSCHVGALDLADALIRGGRCARCARYDPAGLYRAAQSSAGPWSGALPRYCS